ncbi:MAG TPA: hypothetical protein PKH40_08995 [Treponemataceae bacterium]|jgi:tetratricopeptide (TPR) repeat protein|nr:hypothetical protein [Treponemataceae bacterium]HQL31869.1 hypothetical protein [Treponemataceae bacterium]
MKTGRTKQIGFCLAACFFLAGVLGDMYALDYFTEGVRLFRDKQYAEAVPLLYQASVSERPDPKVFLYLGLSYQYTGKLADAVSAFIRGTAMNGTDRAVLFFNAGNVYFIQDMFTEAEAMFNKSVEANASYARVWLNRANARVRLGKFAEAVQDYTQYLYLDPATWQQGAIRQMITVLQAEENEKQSAVLRAEAERATAEAERKAAEERYQKLLDAINSSLQSVDDASTVSAGSEQILDYNEEGQLE